MTRLEGIEHRCVTGVVAAPAPRRKSELRKGVVGVRYYLQRVGALAKARWVAYYVWFPSTHLLPRVRTAPDPKKETEP
ncbi:hypothetical protein DRO59_00845 [Candidatus Bathyarchaeota archaeon]|nr:MAG: hypothetical protein DRO59_00845 [Candidatus Bathyarchaeota archaeon]